MFGKIETIKTFFLSLQQSICQAVTEFEPEQNFLVDPWQRNEGGGGITCVLENGLVFEKAGVNFSHVQGKNLPPSATNLRPNLSIKAFEALGVSVVIHPVNPFVPTSHFNIRFFVAQTENNVVWWFGGGFDLTPYYGFVEDCIHWHTVAKESCDKLDKNYYSCFKQACDDYFYLPHRNEARGIGGLFFDDFNKQGFEHSFDFAQSISKGYLRAYMPIVEKRYKTPYQEEHRDFQAYRRGRYVEFNLLYDRGTLFGLQSNGRTESILMSLPPVANWCYQKNDQFITDENELKNCFLRLQDWLKI